jgi:hypothetical protein
VLAQRHSGARPGAGRTTHLLVQISDPDLAVAMLFSGGNAPGSRSAWFAAEGVAAGESLVVAPSTPQSSAQTES